MNKQLMKWIRLATRMGLSLGLLFYPVGLPQAHPLSDPPTGEESAGIQMLAPSAHTEISHSKESVSLHSEPKTDAPPVEKTAGDVDNSKTNLSKEGDHSAGMRNSSKANDSIFDGGKGTRVTKPVASTAPVVILPDGKKARTEILARAMEVNKSYHDMTGQWLLIRSLFRTPADQSAAIYGLLRLYGVGYVINLYRQKAAIREIVNAFILNRRRPHRALMAMTRVIEAQVERGVIISRHMLGRAFDVRSRGPNRAKLSALMKVVQKKGGRVLVERNCYHVDI